MPDEKGAPTPSKRCTGCKHVKPLTEFYTQHWLTVNGEPRVGPVGLCKTCDKKRCGAWQKANPDKVPTISEKFAAWRARHPDKYAAYMSRKGERAAKHRAKYPEKKRARDRAIRVYPERRKCSILGCLRIGERHHPDYSKPELIVWLCKKHHQEAHRG